MDTTTCIVCGKTIEGIRITMADFLEYLELDSKLEKHEIGAECQHCGATYCEEQCKRKHLKFSRLRRRWPKIQCTRCGKPIGPGYLILSPDSSIETLRRYAAPGAQTIDQGTFSRMAQLIDRREWEDDANKKAQLLDLLKDHGESFFGRCMKEIAVEMQTTKYDLRLLRPRRFMEEVDRIGSLAEVGASWLFADGDAEDLLAYVVKQDESCWPRKPSNHYPGDDGKNGSLRSCHHHFIISWSGVISTSRWSMLPGTRYEAGTWLCQWHSLERDEFGKYYNKEVHK